MKFKLFFKSTFRRPVRTILLVVVIGLVAFTTVSRGSEYLTLKQESEKLSEYYRAIGYLEPLGNIEDTDSYDTQAAENILEASSYINFVDHQSYTSGVMKDGIYNTMMNGFFTEEPLEGSAASEMNFRVTDVFFYGTLKRAQAPMNTGDDYKMDFAVDTVLAGFPEYIIVDAERTIRVKYAFKDEFSDAFSELVNGERYFIHARLEPDGYSAVDNFDNPLIYIERLPDDDAWFKHAPENLDLTAAEFSKLSKIIDIVDSNQRSLQINVTRDMSALPYMLESEHSHYISEGRMIDYNDYLEGKRVCVVHSYFAEVRGLKVGDTLNLELRNLKYPYWGFLNNIGDIENMDSYETASESFEIVGIFRSVLDDDVTYTHQMCYRVYVPSSSVPNSFKPDHYYLYPDNISFVLNSPDDIEAFTAETADALAAVGVKVTFMDTGYDNFIAMSKPMISSSLTNALLYSCLSGLVLIISVFVYFRSERRNFAISRAMGGKRISCAMGAALPLTVLGFIGTLAGGAAAYIHTSQNIQNTLTKFSELGLEAANTVLEVNIPIIITGSIFLLLIIAAAVGGLILAARPVLELIQGGAKRNA